MSGGGKGTIRPLIGISTYREQARWGAWDVPAVLLPATYADAVAECGGEPVLLPTGSTSADVVARLDGLVLAGGADIEPARYGQEPGSHTRVLRPERDAAELAVLRAALDRDLPLLAICRGMQLLNVALGGDLVQHLPDVPGTGSHHAGDGVFARREVRTAPGTTVAKLLGSAAPADCHHHQALGNVAAGLVPAAWAEDGVLEAVEAAGRRFCLGVQWHPEAGEDRRLFGGLVDAAREPIG
jgi:anthranilate synthase component 2/putative glutamine amidotransferase